MSTKRAFRIENQVWFLCPACNRGHAIRFGSNQDGWTWNGSEEMPTFHPSIKATYRHPQGHTNENPAPIDYSGSFVDDICHSFVRDGRIEFLSDCTHALAGQTVDLPPYKW